MHIFHKSLVKTLALSLASFSFSAGRIASVLPPESGDSSSPVSREVEQLVCKQETRPEEIAAYLNKNSRPLSNILLDSIKKNPVTILGEYHLEEFQPVRDSFMKSMPELKEAGLTHLFIEIADLYQKGFDEKDPAIMNLLGKGSSQDMFKIACKAEEHGLKVVFFDKKNDGSDSYAISAYRQNLRDSNMSDCVIDVLRKVPGARVILYTGSAHVHEKCVETYGQDEEVFRVGARLAAQLGEKKVTSIRGMINSGTFDGLCISEAPELGELKELLTLPANVYAVPDDGPCKGDYRVTKSDYIVFEIPAKPK